jgi:hypothetical protein
MSKKYYYFVSYSIPTGFGNAGIERDRKIKSFQDLKDITKAIEGLRESNKNAVILNYKILEKPPKDS